MFKVNVIKDNNNEINNLKMKKITNVSPNRNIHIY